METSPLSDNRTAPASDAPTGSPRRPHIAEYIFLAAALILALLVRLAFVNQLMRYDESHTFLQYIVRPGELLHYSAPNNHLFHTILLWLTTALFGDEPWAIRIPAFVAGIVAIPLTWKFTRDLNDGDGGHFSAVAMAVFPFMVLFSTNARGYTLITCLTLMLAMSIHRLLRDPESVSPRQLCWISLLTSLGLWTIPSMLYPIGGLFLWLLIGLLIQSKLLRVFDTCFSIGVLTTVMTSLMYAPTLLRERGFYEVFQNPFVRKLAAERFYSGIFGHVERVYVQLFRDVPTVACWALLIMFLIGVFRSANRKDAAALLMISVYVGTGSVFLLKQSFPFARSWIFLIPFLFVFADLGITSLLKKLPRYCEGILLAGLLVAASLFAYRLVEEDVIERYPDTGRFPEVREVAEFLQANIKESDTIFAPVPFNEPLSYYLYKRGLDKRVAYFTNPKTRNFIVTRPGKRHTNTDGLEEVFRFESARVYIRE